MKNALGLVAIVLALVAIGMSWKGSSPKAAEVAAPEAIDLGPLVARIAALEKESGDLRRALESERLQTPAREAVAPNLRAIPVEEISAALAQMEKSIEELRAKQEAIANSNSIGSRFEQLNLKEGLTVDQATARARDLAASEAERLKALGALRGQRLADGTDARLPVLDDMIRLAQSSTEGATRADVWRQLSHVTDARLKGPLLDALALDKDEKAREEAAETLADFMPDRLVEAALRNAAANDASKKVRSQAGSSLAGGH